MIKKLNRFDSVSGKPNISLHTLQDFKETGEPFSGKSFCYFLMKRILLKLLDRERAHPKRYHEFMKSDTFDFHDILSF